MDGISIIARASEVHHLLIYMYLWIYRVCWHVTQRDKHAECLLVECNVTNVHRYDLLIVVVKFLHFSHLALGLLQNIYIYIYISYISEFVRFLQILVVSLFV